MTHDSDSMNTNRTDSGGSPNSMPMTPDGHYNVSSDYAVPPKPISRNQNIATNSDSALPSTSYPY